MINLMVREHSIMNNLFSYLLNMILETSIMLMSINFIFKKYSYWIKYSGYFSEDNKEG
jgi:hypothetical protein